MQHKGHPHADDVTRQPKKQASGRDPMNTITVVIVVSRRLGHVILATSWRTSCKNLKGLTLAIVPIPIVADCNSLPRPTRLRPLPYPRRCGEGKGGGCREKCSQPHTGAAAPILDGRDRSRAFLGGCKRGGNLKRDRRRRHYLVPMASKIKSAVNMDSGETGSPPRN